MYAADGPLHRLSRTYAGGAFSVLDVGAYDPGFITSFDWIPTKVVVDIESWDDSNFVQDAAVHRRVWAQTRGVAFVVGDFTQLKWGTRFDLVFCNQVVEHLPHGVVELFVEQLMRVARVLIVTTTADLPKGTLRGHVQDPIPRSEFESWFEDRPGNATHAPVRGRIVEYLRVPGGNPNNNYTLPNALLGRRVPAFQHIVVWKKARAQKQHAHAHAHVRSSGGP